MTSRIGIMQPYFFPYIGYFQLLAHVDRFVVYDNIKYTKKGWINRNRLLLNGAPETFSVPLKAAPDTLDVVEREVSPAFFPPDLVNKMSGAYRKAPFYSETMPLVESAASYPGRNLFAFLRNCLELTIFHLGLTTPVLVSSDVEADHGLKGQERVISICKALGASTYVNPVGGMELYRAADFAAEGMELSFLKSRLTPYKQFGAVFVPALSILDVLFFNGRDRARELVLTDYELLRESV